MLENFTKEIVASATSIEELDELEMHWINKYDAVKNPMFYNLARGGTGMNIDPIVGEWFN